MAQFVHQYVKALLDGQVEAGKQVGLGVYYIDRQTYLLNLTTLTIIGTVMKKISELVPTVTDQVWLDALGHALDSSPELPWPQDMLNQLDPNRETGV